MMSCGDYDYIEIVCMHQYSIQLTLKSGVTLSGIALDIQRNECREECIKLMVEGLAQLIVLDQISKLDVVTDNPHFKSVNFN